MTAARGRCGVTNRAPPRIALMVLWICLAIVVVALGVLLVLVLELRAKQQRLQQAIDKAQIQTAPEIAIIRSLQHVQPPRKPAKPQRTVAVPAPDRG